MPPRNVPDRNLALELVRVTEAAALAAGRYVGRGDKEAADQVVGGHRRAVRPDALEAQGAAKLPRPVGWPGRWTSAT